LSGVALVARGGDVEDGGVIGDVDEGEAGM
jgi:hypothetical protein